MGAVLLGSVRLVLFMVWTLVLIPAQAVALGLRLEGAARRIPMLYHRGCLVLTGIELNVRGARCTDRPVLFVSNHCSYLDVTALGAVIPGCFVAKTEVRSWPLFGLLARLQRSVFIERRARSAVGRQRDDLRDRLEGGDSVILFPEGTSSDGNRTLPFKTSLFAAASVRPGGAALTVQPVSLVPTRLDGMPMGLCDRPLYAWYGDMELLPHLWAVFASGRITVEIEFHPPVTIEAFASRKALADHCWQVISRGVGRALSGRAAEGAGPTPEETGETV
jgi:lyso-ornithine lipid O-acyltransferase